jgi:hypothetical protein
VKMVCRNLSFVSLKLKIAFLEPEPSTTQIEKDDSVINHDGWLNALTLEKLTTTVCQIYFQGKNLILFSFKGHESCFR